jgi:hypothetical protein
MRRHCLDDASMCFAGRIHLCESLDRSLWGVA